MDIKQKAFEQIKQLNLLIKKSNYLTSEILEKNFNYEFTVKIDNKIYKILTYFGKKGVKTILLGDQNSSQYDILKKMIFQEDELINSEEPEEYIGTDESGKGDYFGPLVVAAVYVDSEIKNKLKKLRVKDSKKLSDNQITALSKEILTILKGKYNIVTINPKKYNELYNKFKNLNLLLNWAHSKAIENLLKETNCNLVITDKFSGNELNISRNKNHTSVKFIQEIKAEKFIGVAAASVLARNKFNEWFIKQSKYGMDLIKGSSTKVEDVARELIKKIGSDSLHEFAKLNFKTTKNILTK